MPRKDGLGIFLIEGDIWKVKKELGRALWERKIAGAKALRHERTWFG